MTALNATTEEQCTDAIAEAIRAKDAFNSQGPQTKGWAILDGGKGDCDNLAYCMKVAVEMLGLPAATQNVYASTNAGASNCISYDRRDCTEPSHAREYLLLMFQNGINEYEGCCVAAGKYYAINPFLKADNDYEMLKKLGVHHGVTQRWCGKYNYGIPSICIVPPPAPSIP